MTPIKLLVVLLLVAITLAPNAGRADDECPKAMVQLGQSIKGKVEGDLSTLFKIGKIKALGDIDSTTQDLLHTYPNADQVALQQNVLSILCSKILSSPDYSTDFKQKVIDKMLDSIALAPSKRTSLILPLLKIKLGSEGTTSIDFLKSSLGPPVFADKLPSFYVDNSSKYFRARFETESYTLTASFDDDGIITGVLLEPVGDGSSNSNNEPNGYLPRFLGHEFTTDTEAPVVFGSKLKDFVGGCYFDEVGGRINNTDAAMFCYSGGSSVDGGVYVLYYIGPDSTGPTDDHLFDLIDLRNYYWTIGGIDSSSSSDSVRADVPCTSDDQNCSLIIEKLDKELGVSGLSTDQKRVALNDRLSSELQEMVVSAVQVSTFTRPLAETHR